MKINVKDDAFKALQSRLEIVTDFASTGEEFAEAMRHLIGEHKPDLVWFDPLLSFVGDDISRQDVCSRFLRQLLNPIADETGVVWMIMHHTPKPSADPKSKSNWNRTDMSYSAAGSSELVNWARLVKSDAELVWMREAGQICTETMHRALAKIAPGVPQYEVIAEVYHAQIMGVNGKFGDYTAFCPLIQVGERTSTSHLTWTDEPLPSNALVMMELSMLNFTQHFNRH